MPEKVRAILNFHIKIPHKNPYSPLLYFEKSFQLSHFHNLSVPRTLSAHINKRSQTNLRSPLRD